MRRFLSILVVGILLVSCKTQNLYEKVKPNEASYFQYDPNYQYHIRKDDKISISVWGEDNLSVGSTYGIYNSNEVYGKWLMVDFNGNIEIPQLGTTNVLNKTVPEFKAELATKLKKWLVNPIVDVKILNKDITVLGEVRDPAVVPVDKDHNSLLELISKTGGFDYYANLKQIKVLRQEGEHVRVTTVNLMTNKDILNTNIMLHPGDIVIVPSRKFKVFDKRISVLIPFTSTVTAAAIITGFFN